jgi:hypothetical protein
MTTDQIPTVNRQAVLNQPGEAYEIVDGAVPKVGPTQALVNLTHSGCCYTSVTTRMRERPTDEVEIHMQDLRLVLVSGRRRAFSGNATDNQGWAH